MKSDELWKLSDEEMIALATEELGRIGIIEAGQVLDATVLQMEKTYPAYFGTYDRFPEIREHVDPIRTCSWLDVTACIATITRTTPC